MTDAGNVGAFLWECVEPSHLITYNVNFSSKFINNPFLNIFVFIIDADQIPNILLVSLVGTQYVEGNLDSLW